MYRMEVDLERNLLHVTLEGKHTVAEAEEIHDQVLGHVEQLPGGFTVFTDLSRLKEMETGASSVLSRTMDLCNAHGVGRVVRVIPEPTTNFGFNIMSYFNYDEGVEIITCETVPEALAHVSPSRDRSD